MMAVAKLKSGGAKRRRWKRIDKLSPGRDGKSMDTTDMLLEVSRSVGPGFLIKGVDNHKRSALGVVVLSRPLRGQPNLAYVSV
jgi:hypothetical protein